METPDSNFPQLNALQFFSQYASAEARAALFPRESIFETGAMLDMYERMQTLVNCAPYHPTIQADTFAFGTSDEFVAETLRNSNGFSLVVTFENSEMYGLEEYAPHEPIDMAVGIYHPTNDRSYSMMEVASVSMVCYDTCKKILFELSQACNTNNEIMRWMRNSPKIVNNDVYSLTGYCIQFKFEQHGYV